MNIVVYTKPACPACIIVKRFLQQKNLPYQEVNLTDDEKKSAFLAAYPGIRTMPQVIVDGVRVEDLTRLGEVLNIT